jgi:hypothetical protein
MEEGYQGPVVDAHLHFVEKDEYFDRIALAAGHENREAHLKKEYEKNRIVHGIVMGNRSLDLEFHQYPSYLSYCVGLDSTMMKDKKQLRDAADMTEKHLKRENCVGIKLYPGYHPVYITDACYEPFYDLAKAYKKPVAVHTGETAGSKAILKYSHPLTVDEAAALHPDVQFVMCHFGNPWLNDAAAVMSKNSNVATDLSGLLEGVLKVDELFQNKSGYLGMLRGWLEYFDYRDVMFGTDWPLVNLENYLEFIWKLVPERYWEQVFYKNACRIYGLKNNG